MPLNAGVPCDHAKRRTHRNSVLRQLRELQEIAYADCQCEETKPAERAQLMRAYVALEQQRNVLRMRPAPKPIDVSDRAKNKRQRSSPAPVLLGAPAQPTPFVNVDAQAAQRDSTTASQDRTDPITRNV